MYLLVFGKFGLLGNVYNNNKPRSFSIPYGHDVLWAWLRSK